MKIKNITEEALFYAYYNMDVFTACGTLDISPKTLYSLLDRYGMPRKTQRASVTKEELEEMYKTFTVKQLTKIIRCSKDTLYRMLEAYGIKKKRG